MSDEPKKPEWRWLSRWLLLLFGSVLAFAAYMGAYYATVTVDTPGGRPGQSYKIGRVIWSDWSVHFFMIADWIDDRIHVAPSRKHALTR